MRRQIVAAALAVLMVGAAAALAKDPPPPGAKCTVGPIFPLAGDADNTAAINAAIGATPDGGTLCLAAREFRTEGTVRILGRHDLTLRLAGSTLFATSLVGDTDPADPKCCHRRHVEITLSSGIKLDRPTIRSANETCTYASAYEFEHAFSIEGSSDVTLDRPAASHVAGDFVYLTDYSSPTVPRTETFDVRVVAPAFDCSGRQGIASGGGVHGVVATGGTWDRVARSLVDIEQNRDDNTTTEFSFTYNVVGSVGNVACCGGGRGSVAGVEFSHNTLERMRLKVGSPNGVVDWANVEIVGNTAAPAVFGGSPPWGFVGVVGLVFTDNAQPLSAGAGASSALGLTDTCDVLASGNSVLGASAFWPPPGPPGPAGCLWTDGGGNTT